MNITQINMACTVVFHKGRGFSFSGHEFARFQAKKNGATMGAAKIRVVQFV